MEFASHCTHLQLLDVHFLYRITDVGLSYLSRYKCNSLKVLYLGGCKKITDAGIHHLCDVGHSLEVLSLKNLRKITDTSLRDITNHCACVRSINLTNCILITTAGANELLAKYVELETLVLKLCPLVDSTAIKPGSLSKTSVFI